MSIDLKALKIDPTGKGVTPLPDTPALSEEEMQAKFDELPLACIEQINNVIDDLLCLKEAIANAVGVVIPKTTALLRGDGEGNVDEQPVDDEPLQDSQNPITSGAVYETVNTLKNNLPTGAVELWSGLWSSGNITVSKIGGSAGCTGKGNASDFPLLILETGNQAIICSTKKGLASGGYGFIADNSVLCLRAIRHSVSGDIITRDACKYSYATESGWSKPQSTEVEVTAIYGMTLQQGANKTADK